LTGVVPPATVPTTRLLVRSPSQKTSSAALEKPHYETPDNIGTIQPPGTSKINGWDPAPAKEKTPDFVPSRALTRAMPNMRSIPPGTIPKRTKVRVQVEVDQTGRVTFARIISIGVNSKVSTAALDAARQWTFDPAKSNGQHVTSEHTIVFDFPAR
jgi:TonB family protein